jgi:adenine-specific DNA-methyltransferase
MFTLTVACEALKSGTLSVQDAALALDAASQLHASTRKNQGVTYTPWDVACNVVAQADPRPSESWLDTSLGRGIFLWATLSHMQGQGASLPEIEDFLHNRLHAVELNEQAAVDARCLLGAWCEYTGIKPPVRLWLTNADSLSTRLPRVDVMVGNPPYVRIQHLPTAQRDQMRQQFNSCAQGNVDLYYAFFEQALCNARRGAFIAPNSWLTNNSAATLRRLLAERTTTVIDFYQHLLFAPVRAYTAVWVWNEARLCGIDVVRQDGWNGATAKQSRQSLRQLMGAPWPDPLRVAIVGKTATIPLHELASVHSGIATLADKIYTVHLVSQDPTNLEWKSTTFDGSTLVLEDAALVPLYKWTKDASAGAKADKTRAVIYPYHASGKAWTDSEFKTLAPNAYAYMCKHKGTLSQRDKGAGQYEAWFAYGRRQGLHTHHDKALGISTMWSGPATAVSVGDASAPYLFVSGFVLRPLPGVDTTRLAKALSHPDVWEQVRARGKMWAGDKPYRTLGAPLLRSLNIPY